MDSTEIAKMVVVALCGGGLVKIGEWVRAMIRDRDGRQAKTRKEMDDRYDELFEQLRADVAAETGKRERLEERVAVAEERLMKCEVSHARCDERNAMLEDTLVRAGLIYPPRRVAADGSGEHPPLPGPHPKPEGDR